MLSKEEIENLLDCSKCKLKECIGCDITYTDRKNIRKYIDVKELELKIEKEDHKCTIDCANFEINNLESEKQKLIEKLEKDIAERGAL